MNTTAKPSILKDETNMRPLDEYIAQFTAYRKKKLEFMQQKQRIIDEMLSDFQYIIETLQKKRESERARCDNKAHKSFESCT